MGRTFVAALLLACGGDSQVIDPGDDDDDDDDGPGAVVRGSLTVTVSVASADAHISTILGSPAGVLRNADVTIRRQGESATQTAATDSTGAARFTELLEGQYVITVGRLLSSSDRARLEAADPSLADVNAFGGGGFAEVDPPTSSTTVKVIAGRRGSLVFGELFSYEPNTGGAFLYNTAKYVEFTNNADSTIYMDGKLLGRQFFWAWEAEQGSCAYFDTWRLDPRGVWVAYYVRFPGSGRQYPVAPGASVILARDAIDHRPADPTLPDLSGARFEYVGAGDVDNPAAVNVEDAGPQLWYNQVTGGLFFQGKEVLVLAERVDIESLERQVIDYFGSALEIHLIPASAVLDVLSATRPPEQQNAGQVLCEQLVHPSFDAQYSTLLDTSSPQTLGRSLLTTLLSGRPLLQRTRTSARDFEKRAPSPGQVP